MNSARSDLFFTPRTPHTARSADFQSPRSARDFVTPRSPNGNVPQSTQLPGSPNVVTSSVVLQQAKVNKMANKEKKRKELFRLVRHGKYDEVERLLRMGVKVDSEDEHGNTILFIAAQNGNKRIVKLALRMGANIKHVNGKGNTVLHFALHMDMGPWANTCCQ